MAAYKLLPSLHYNHTHFQSKYWMKVYFELLKSIQNIYSVVVSLPKAIALEPFIK